MRRSKLIPVGLVAAMSVMLVLLVGCGSSKHVMLPQLDAMVLAVQKGKANYRALYELQKQSIDNERQMIVAGAQMDIKAESTLAVPTQGAASTQPVDGAKPTLMVPLAAVERKIKGANVLLMANLLRSQQLDQMAGIAASNLAGQLTIASNMRQNVLLASDIEEGLLKYILGLADYVDAAKAEQVTGGSE